MAILVNMNIIIMAILVNINIIIMVILNFFLGGYMESAQNRERTSH